MCAPLTLMCFALLPGLALAMAAEGHDHEAMVPPDIERERDAENHRAGGGPPNQVTAAHKWECSQEITNCGLIELSKCARKKWGFGKKDPTCHEDRCDDYFRYSDQKKLDHGTDLKYNKKVGAIMCKPNAFAKSDCGTGSWNLVRKSYEHCPAGSHGKLVEDAITKEHQSVLEEQTQQSLVSNKLSNNTLKVGQQAQLRVQQDVVVPVTQRALDLAPASHGWDLWVQYMKTLAVDDVDLAAVASELVVGCLTYPSFNEPGVPAIHKPMGSAKCIEIRNDRNKKELAPERISFMLGEFLSGDDLSRVKDVRKTVDGLFEDAKNGRLLANFKGNNWQKPHFSHPFDDQTSLGFRTNRVMEFVTMPCDNEPCTKEMAAATWICRTSNSCSKNEEGRKERIENIAAKLTDLLPKFAITADFFDQVNSAAIDSAGGLDREYDPTNPLSTSGFRVGEPVIRRPVFTYPSSSSGRILNKYAIDKVKTLYDENMDQLLHSGPLTLRGLRRTLRARLSAAMTVGVFTEASLMYSHGYLDGNGRTVRMLYALFLMEHTKSNPNFKMRFPSWVAEHMAWKAQYVANVLPQFLNVPS